MKKALFIVGPTAAGKTALAVKISTKFPSTLISSDSIQVYKDCNIISGKDHPKNIQIFLLDTLPTDESFNVSDFVKKSTPIIKKSLKEGKIPIIAGGTGFYSDSLYRSIDTLNIPPNTRLRKSLEKKSVKELQEKLKKLNRQRFVKMNNSDMNNKRRLIRAIEVAGLNVSKIKPLFKEDRCLIIGLRTDMSELKMRIRERVEERIKMGALIEAKKLFKQYNNLSSQIRSANGYKQMFRYLLGELTYEQAREQWVIADYQHARKQMTWFRRNPNIHWFDIGKSGCEEEILRQIDQNFSSN